MVKINNKVWQQEIQLTDGRQVALSLWVKKYAVLYFYPRANTPGCTTESQDFTAEYDAFKALDCEILGVSMDSLKKQQNFKKKYDMPFELVADVDESLCQEFQVIKEKNMYGKKFMGIERSTFLIDSSGHVLQSWRKVKVPGHVQDVLTAVKELWALIGYNVALTKEDSDPLTGIMIAIDFELKAVALSIKQSYNKQTMGLNAKIFQWQWDGE